MSVNEKMTALADAVREKTGETALLTLDGITEGVSKAYAAGAEAGKKSQYDEFWDNFQDYGKRTDYARAFARGWTDNTFRPKYDIKTGASIAFMFGYATNKLTDLAENLEECGVVLDTSATTDFSEWVGYGYIKRVPEISTVSADSLGSIFYAAWELETIDKLILREDGTQKFIGASFYCGSLKNITIEGKIGNNVNFSAATKLTHESLESITGALYDYSETETTRTLTVGSTNLEKLSEENIATVTQKGWTLV